MKSSIVGAALQRIAQENTELTAVTTQPTDEKGQPVGAVAPGGTPKAGDTLVMQGPLAIAISKALQISHAKIDPSSVAVESQAIDAVLAAQAAAMARAGADQPLDPDQDSVLVYTAGVRDNTQDGPTAKDVFADIERKFGGDGSPIDFVIYFDEVSPARKAADVGQSDMNIRAIDLDKAPKVTTGNVAVESVQVIVRLKKA